MIYARLICHVFQILSFSETSVLRFHTYTMTLLPMRIGRVSEPFIGSEVEIHVEAAPVGAGVIWARRAATVHAKEPSVPSHNTHTCSGRGSFHS